MEKTRKMARRQRRNNNADTSRADARIKSEGTGASSLLAAGFATRGCADKKMYKTKRSNHNLWLLLFKCEDVASRLLSRFMVLIFYAPTPCFCSLLFLYFVRVLIVGVIVNI